MPIATHFFRLILSEKRISERIAERTMELPFFAVNATDSLTPEMLATCKLLPNARDTQARVRNK